jgi:hypothetical protein
MLAEAVKEDIFVHLKLCLSVFEFFNIKFFKGPVELLQNLVDLRCSGKSENEFDVRNNHLDRYFMFCSEQAYPDINLMLNIGRDVKLGPEFIQDVLFGELLSLYDTEERLLH